MLEPPQVTLRGRLLSEVSGPRETLSAWAPKKEKLGVLEGVTVPTEVPSSISVVDSKIPPNQCELLRMVTHIFFGQLIGKPVKVQFCGKRSTPPPFEEKEGEFIVFVDGTPRADVAPVRLPLSMFGYSVFEGKKGKKPRLTGIKPSVQAMEFIRSGDMVIAQLYPHCLYILFDVVAVPSGNGMWIYRSILEKVAQILVGSPEVMKVYRERIENAKIDAFIAACAAADRVYAEQLGKEIQIAQTAAADALAKYVAEHKKVESKTRERAMLEVSSTEAGRSALIQTYRELKELPYVRRFECSGDRIIVYTDTLFHFDRETDTWRRLGDWRITIYTDGSSGGFKCENLTGRIGTRHAPHISDNGGCLGDFRLEIPALVKERAWGRMIVLLIQYIQWQNAYSRGNGFSHTDFDKWPQATPAEIEAIRQRRVS